MLILHLVVKDGYVEFIVIRYSVIIPIVVCRHTYQKYKMQTAILPKGQMHRVNQPMAWQETDPMECIIEPKQVKHKNIKGHENMWLSKFTKCEFTQAINRLV